MTENIRAEADAMKPENGSSKTPRELTLGVIVLGSAIAIVFGAANAYLGLRAGMTVSASIPAAVISMAIFRALGRRGALLENNMVQTIGSSGESVAAGTIFTVPALILWGLPTDILQVTLLALLGGLLGVLMMIPLRHHLIVEEHATLPYPEGTACAEVLRAGEKGGVYAKTVFGGLGFAALYKLLADGLKIFPSVVEHAIPRARNAVIGMEAVPSLLGIGYILGLRIAALVFAGGVLGRLVFIPLISLVGSHLSAPLPPAATLISDMTADDIAKYYLRYIGAGAVALAGLLSLAKSVPMLMRSIGGMFRRAAGAAERVVRREDWDLGPMFVFGGSIVLIAAIAMLPVSQTVPVTRVGILAAVLIAIFGFFFVAVTSRIVGIIGNSSCPVSGMTIATLLVCALILRWAGYQVEDGKVVALVIGAVVCIAIANAGDTSQDLKTGFLVGATPRRQQIGLMIGVLASALFVGLTILLLDRSQQSAGVLHAIGTKELPAPQATVMSVIIPGILKGNLPWDLVFVGALTAIVIELLGIAALPFAIGLYLPITTSTPIMIGGILHWLVVERRRRKDAPAMEATNGTLFASGYIAGDALVGILLALLVYKDWSLSLEKYVHLGPLATWIAFAILAVFLARVDWRRNDTDNSPPA